MRRYTPVFAVALALSLAGGVPCLAQNGHIATVKTLSGHGTIIDAATGARNPAAIGTQIHTGDRLATDADGAMGVTFLDNTTMSLGPSSEIALSRFEYDPPEARYGFAAPIARGTFLFATGLIAKYAPDQVAVSTPSGSIGIRGTRFLVKVDAK
jgi:hypothetical protein